MLTLADRIVRCVLPLAIAASAAAASAPPASIDSWSDTVWNAARSGDRKTVDQMLASVPDGQASEAVQKLRAAIALRDQHSLQTKQDADKKRTEKLQEMKDAMTAGQAAKALVAGAYLKYLSEDWRTQVQSPDIQELISFADKKAAAARAAGDWVLAEDLLIRLRTLYEGTPLKDQYQRYDDILETDVSPRVTLILEYAPRMWYGLRKAQWERLDPKDRTVASFPPFSEKGANDWKSQLDGLSEAMLTDALSQIAVQHLDNVGWKPLIEGGLTMVKLLATTSALKENFPSLGENAASSAFAEAVQAQRDVIKSLKPSEVDARTFGRVLAALHKANDMSVKLPFEVIIREFGNGAISTMTHDFEDPYTEIVWPDRMRRFNQAIKGNFVGVGVLIRHNDNREIMIVNPLDGSPAMRAGLQYNDKITAVNGVPTADWALDRAVEAITGPSGSTVTLTITRDGKKDESPSVFDVPLVRQRIKMYSVQGWKKTGKNDRSEPVWDWYIEPEEGIGYLNMTGFNEDTYNDFLRALTDMNKERPLNGLILDLRGNPGGLMQSAIRIANTFMKSGRIVSVEDRNKIERQATDANPTQAVLADMPTVVLINEGSASASEIVSGALEASDTAVVVGERSFGKGSVQEVHQIGGRGAGGDGNVKITVQHYLLPPKPGEAKGRLVHKRPGSEDWGVVPDYIVRLTPMQMEEINKIRASANGAPPDADEQQNLTQPNGDPTNGATVPVREKRDPSELIGKGFDPQLETAVILLQSRILKDAEKQAMRTPRAAPTNSSAPTTAAKNSGAKSSL